MLEIAILNDEKKDLQLISFLSKYNMEYSTDNNLTVFSSARDLCVAIGKKQKFNLIFIDLDIVSDKTSKIIACIRKHLSRESIGLIFISSVKENFTDDINIYAFECLTPPLTYDRVKHCMDIYMHINAGYTDWFVYTKDKYKHNIKVSKIIYLEERERKTTIHTQEGKIEFYLRLSECMKEICFNNFIEVHKSFLVNPAYVERADKRYLTVAGNVKVPISRHRMKTVATLFPEKRQRIYINLQ